VGVVSEYRYRGIGQTKGDAALQGGLDYAYTNGFYVGAWASSIKWIKDAALGTDPSAKQAKAPVELDLYGGYKFEAAGIAYDVGFLRYQYVGNTYKDAAPGVNVNANTNEVYGAATFGPATLKYSQATSNLFGYSDSKGSSYLDLSATFDLGDGYSFVPHAGRQTIKNANSGYGYSDFALTLNKDLGDGLTASVAAIKTTANETLYKGLSSTNYNAAKNAVVVGVKYSF
jgi:uncharacterized protein (TIGR02001 family)